jgi:hypothetical protein
VAGEWRREIVVAAIEGILVIGVGIVPYRARRYGAAGLRGRAERSPLFLRIAPAMSRRSRIDGVWIIHTPFFLHCRADRYLIGTYVAGFNHGGPAFYFVLDERFQVVRAPMLRRNRSYSDLL